MCAIKIIANKLISRKLLQQLGENCVKIFSFLNRLNSNEPTNFRCVSNKEVYHKRKEYIYLKNEREKGVQAFDMRVLNIFIVIHALYHALQVSYSSIHHFLRV